jgi:hypothetical protein
MSKKIFVSYKYSDSEVRPMASGLLTGTTARHYVDELANIIDINDHIYKGENDNESLEGFKDDTIESKLRDKIFDSTVTLVLISKNMKDSLKKEEDQWIPWEISYSLKEMTRGNRTSGTNAMLAIILPDRNGSYGHFVNPICNYGCQDWQSNNTFKIIGLNMFNRKMPNTTNCSAHLQSGIIHTGSDHSYIHPVRWDNFVADVNGYINLALQIKENINDYEISKSLILPVARALPVKPLVF